MYMLIKHPSAVVKVIDKEGGACLLENLANITFCQKCFCSFSICTEQNKSLDCSLKILCSELPESEEASSLTC